MGLAYQFRKLCEAAGDLGYVLQLDEVLRLENIDDAVAADLTDDCPHAVLHGVLQQTAQA